MAFHRSAVRALPLLLAACLLLAASASAQVTFGGAQRTLPAGTLSLPRSVAVDGGGNVYILDIGLGELLKLAPGGGVTTLASGLSTPQYVTTDSAGNVYYTDAGTGKVTEITAGGVSSTLASGLSSPDGVAVDAQGNVYVEVLESPGPLSVFKILKIALGGTQSTVSTGSYSIGGAGGLALDAAGDLFIADSLNSRILEVSAGGPTTVVSASGLAVPYEVAVDAAGDVFIADSNNSRVVEEPAGGGAQRVLGTGMDDPNGVAVDSSGNVYAADTDNARVLEIQPGGLNFGALSLGTASPTWSLIYNFSGSETLTGASVVTQGATGLDFASVSLGTTCVAGSFGASSQCLLNASFTPAAPGVRAGAATLSTSAGTLITSYLAGTGMGPAPSFSPGTLSTPFSDSVTPATPFGVAVDASGNLYLADGNNDRVLKVPASGGGYGAAVTLASSLNGSVGVAVDGAGNLYISDGASTVIELPWTGAGYGAPTTVASGLDQPYGIAVDASGNVYIAEQSGSLAKLPWTGAGYGAPTTVASGLNQPYGIAVDASGNVYFTDVGTNTVGEVAWTGSGYGTPVQIASGLDAPAGVAVDGNGNVYVSDSVDHQVLELPWTGISFGAPAVLISSTNVGYPDGVAVDAGGNVFVGDLTKHLVLKLDVADAAAASALNFTATYGQTSAPQTILVGNAGNAPLAIGALSLPTGFVQQSSGGTDCAASVSVATNGDCALQLAFQPSTVGTTSGSVILTDNAFNGTGVTQSYNLSGTAGAATITPSLIGTVSKVYDTTTTATLDAANYTFTGQVGSDDVGLSDPTSGAYGSASVGTGINITVTDLALTGTAAGNYQLASASVSGAVGTITAATITPSLIGAVSKVYDGTTAAALTAANYSFTGKLGSDSVGLNDPTVGVYATAAAGTGIGVSASGLALTGTALSNYQLSSTTASAAIGAITPAALTIAANSAAMTYGGTVPTFSGTVSAAVTGDHFTETFSTTATSASAAGTYPITPAVTGTNVADYTITPDNGTLTVNKATLGVTATAVSMAYGAAVPSLTPVYSGFVNGDTVAILAGAPSLTTTASSTSNVGSYPITVTAGTLAAANYGFTFSNGALTITPAAQTITFAAIPTQTYGAPPLTLAATASSGLPIAFTLISGPATLTGTTLTLTGGGMVTVEADQAGNGNYTAAAAVRQSFLVTAPGVMLSAASLSFGGQLLNTPSAAQAVTIENIGNAALAISGIAASGDFSQTNTCGTSLAADGSCAVSVTFTPTALGIRAGALTVATALAGTQMVALTGNGADFTLSLASGSPAQTVDGGGTATWQLALAPGSFTGAVALSCGLAPATAACAITPSTAALTAGGAAVPATLTVATTARSAVPPFWPRIPLPPLRPWLWLLAALPLALYRRRSRRWLLGVVACGALLAAGCGGVSNLPDAGEGTPPGVYQITVTAAVGNATQTIHLSLTVN